MSNGVSPFPADRAPLCTLGHLDNLFRSLAERAPFSLAFCQDKFTDHAAWRQEAWRYVMDSLCFDPGPFRPQAQVLERVEEDDVVREKLVFNSAPGIQVPAYLLLPRGKSGPFPAIVACHDHGGMLLWGKEKLVALPGEGQPLTNFRNTYYSGVSLAHFLARHGYAVIVTDAILFGERTAAPEEIGIERLLSERNTYTQSQVNAFNGWVGQQLEVVQRHLMLVGTTWAGLMIWDDIRTVDYLCTRPEIDPNRIGCLGLSMGAYRTNFLLALDERVKAGVSVCWMSELAAAVGYNVANAIGWFMLIPGLYQALDLPDFMALCIPRSLMVMLGWQDLLFQPSAMQNAAKRIQDAYNKAGCTERYQVVMGNHPHQFNSSMQEQALAWLDKWLGKTREKSPGEPRSPYEIWQGYAV